MKKTFYLTTPIYYPSGKLHIGHSYTTVAADAMCRYKRLKGFDVMFLTGTDEHGQKIQMKAAEAGVTPKDYVDNIVIGIRKLWETLDIRYDRFIRTTDANHEKAIQYIFQKLYDKGDIYKSEYEGWYCTPCESFWTQTQIKESNCPDCGRPVYRTKEESYFFRISKYQDALIKLFEENPDFIEPASRTNEMLNNFLRPGLDDLCVSRTTFDWGVKVPFDPKHVVYVWIDALSNYITALGYPEDNDGDFARYWPADVHLVGKEIVRFHTIIWPAMLMALDLPLPKKVFGHGWLLLDGGKISKSKENKTVNIVDPVILCERYGVDAVRYFLLREVQFGSDGLFTNESLIGRINSDLANDLGNLVSRTAAMIEKYFGAWIPKDRETTDFDADLIGMCSTLCGHAEEYMEKLQFSLALAEIWKVIGRCNKYIDETSPWLLAKTDETKARLAGVLFNLAEAIRIISILVEPFMPATSAAIKSNFGISAPEICSWESSKEFGLYYSAEGVKKTLPIFPRIDLAIELEALRNVSGASQNPDKSDAAEGIRTPDKVSDIQGVSLIEFTDFLKVSMKTGKILECRKVEGSEKLLMSQVDIGGETRQILSGIAKFYTPEEMKGKTVIVVTNLKPRKMMGKESCGMLLCAQEGDMLKLLTVEGDIGAGSEVS
ncbi:MAG: methionine--tRNA ligase [Saccharofermentanales bacterium]